MSLLIVAYLGGVLTILSPCILPVLPFVFARTGRPFVRSILPMLLGMAVTFAGVASLAAVGGSWAVHANQYGRDAALVLLALFGLTLLFPSLSDRLTRPLVAAGARLSAAAEGGDRNEILAGLLLGVAVGFLWAPCAGPILGLVLTGAALSGANARTSLLLLSYAAGAATSLALALLVGGRVFKLMKRSLGIGEWARKILGAVVLIAVVVIAFGMDTGVLARLSTASTTKFEQALLDKFGANKPPQALTGATMMPSLDGAVNWINSPPLTTSSLKGKVVLVDFWTYSCINCLRTVPYVEAWAQKYKDAGLVVIGVHTPEFAFERDQANVEKAVKDLGITYPVAIDSNDTIWQAFSNSYWPAEYLVNAHGVIADTHFGEGDYATSEQNIQKLLRDAGAKNVPGGLVDPQAKGAEAAADVSDIASPETYVGYRRGQNFASPERVMADVAASYTTPAALVLNHWALEGSWNIGAEHDVLENAPGKLSFRFHARDLHLVMGPAENGAPVRFRVTIDGMPLGANHGADTDADGNGTVTAQRLYQLIRQSGTVQDHTFTIEFLDPGVEVFSFTFG
jgi:cytochrome c biogenesis protein CcdA/thiol-disulfide isomerase/thioredoxin